ncbi:enoyl-CoA hydratase/isomerase family protein [Stappia taiwanensis]|uniref:Enoyl-CoA hydratase/isomerase family protein n=1 Tax=Stappia taiwanensis TaxID=992267 RepID=A0A838Y3Y9_9HYPH|nr:enoyl-CoA hydratase-related protein [Stappia taiwanensis]MBA4613580.1 enoyl-CoA hydratase/isomerase family protein [Stappia taiwanensis]GGE99028.1 enoyl-CoA hydratase [Stappia taiwanensis]
MAEYEYVLTETRGNVGIVTFNRPDALNALNEQVAQEVTDALLAFDADHSIGCMVLAGGDKAFCAGADLKWIASQDFESAYLTDLAAYMDKVTACRKPVIAAVRGFAFGGGTEISLMCDMIIADTTAQFGLTEVTLGVIPGAGGPARITRAVGKAKAMYYVLTGKTFGAEEAERIGMITAVVEDGTHLDEALKIASRIAANPRLAVLAGKESVNQQAETPLIPGLKLERRLFHGLFSTPDQKEGMAAFAEKRKPDYRKY